MPDWRDVQLRRYIPDLIGHPDDVDPRTELLAATRAVERNPGHLFLPLCDVHAMLARSATCSLSHRIWATESATRVMYSSCGMSLTSV